MPTAHIELRQLLLHIFADDACLNASHHVVLVHPLDLVHAGHIHRNDGSLLGLSQHQGFGDIGSSSEGDQHDLVFAGHVDEMLGLLVAGDVDNVVDGAGKLGVPQHKEFLEGVAVGVVGPGELGGIDFVDLAPDRLDEGQVLDWRVDGHFALGLDGVVDVDADDGLSPLLELGHFLTRKLIAIAGDVDTAVIIDHELGVLVAPAVDLKPLVLVADGLPTLDFFLLQQQAQIFKSLHNKISTVALLNRT